ncbi:hypothetical protein PTSG_11411 [Salpingoeca rosetta]|uniref:Uncharacterized protein n=1 Tax=Salpingoeca rosetta (strain ATCC 50818 / BSB-021) TaxID=946362 RepID=F2UTE8_SALR5|nr:uncharacterized protein PTSG_11411 [Salpingoeca rosetta]EGD82830.1 hypothetical protein PTSG_11411 [Salpingoeca rosetta]|eukprot:XP_004987558.1 hypothetical protein PTSG_11411 [Salpingoeca rosetta]
MQRVIPVVVRTLRLVALALAVELCACRHGGAYGCYSTTAWYFEHAGDGGCRDDRRGGGDGDDEDDEDEDDGNEDDGDDDANDNGDEKHADINDHNINDRTNDSNSSNNSNNNSSNNNSHYYHHPPRVDRRCARLKTLLQFEQHVATKASGLHWDDVDTICRAILATLGGMHTG